MSRTGCNNGCIHNKPVRLQEMKDKYDFRCDAVGSYMKHDDVKQTCRFYQGQYKITPLSLDDFLDE
ncbi:MAG: hypothetical protein LBV09_02700 [Deferribacteraceae bacterium]|nr:hypothetical protein [Deferribacteraceae bacterium]